MPRYVAFLRAINVGGHTVKMDVLRQHFETMKFKNVETLIASGNVIFESNAGDASTLSRKIEKHLHETLGYEVRTFIRKSDELLKVAAHEPFKDADMSASGNAIYVAFFNEPIGADAMRKLKPHVTAWDEFQVMEREVYWLCRRKMSESTFSGAVLEKTLQTPATLRNMTTVRKIAAKFAPQP